MWHIWGRGELHTGFWSGNLKQKDHLKDVVIERRIIFEWIFKQYDGGHGLDSSGSD
jgi:hypothetical protein